ncbi:DUF1761 domain-containing protein [Micromonospora craterilacus]|uniref:DUF1761 domain-containing protein n=1 Tax=Micromonospora craterilacus TaxID=1655439 RepID=A0A2W2DQB5_9ACTN|nr:DUF1761 domain-containing protein [Micromonospora craterilacus]PZG12833.1 DUF1761 domain-containing protein [Micromonospora craterilacus]
MPDVNLVIVPIATVVAFVLGAVYYTVFGNRLVLAGGTAAASPWSLPVEILRCLALAGVVAGLAGAVGADTVPSGLALGLVLWIGFPVVLWVGAIVHANTPWRVAAIHAGDWLGKLLVVGAVVGGWS